MIALDTNVLVRLMVDDAGATEQSLAARKLVLSAAGTGEQILLPNIVLCEFVWVLRRAYGIERADVAATLEQLLATEHLVFESPDAVYAAVVEYRGGAADFADYLLRNAAIGCGSRTIYTFDRKFARSAKVELLS